MVGIKLEIPMPACSVIALLEVMDGDTKDGDPGDNIALDEDTVDEFTSCGL